MADTTMRKVLQAPVDAVLARVPDALKTEGFGVLTQIDVSQTLKQKIGVDFRRYYILGACNPELAHRALQEELELGVMLPCNVIVYEMDDGKTVVSAVDPSRTVATVGKNPRLKELAEDVREKLARALDTLA
jgi:uncharacterized protein (DUF302 family)